MAGQQLAAYGVAAGQGVQYGLNAQDGVAGVVQGLNNVQAVANGNSILVEMQPGTDLGVIQNVANLPGVTKITMVP